MTAVASTLTISRWECTCGAKAAPRSGSATPDHPSPITPARSGGRWTTTAYNAARSKTPSTSCSAETHEQPRPRALSWNHLIESLRREHIVTTEAQLIATPFLFEFSDELLADLAPRA